MMCVFDRRKSRRGGFRYPAIKVVCRNGLAQHLPSEATGQEFWEQHWGSVTIDLYRNITRESFGRIGRILKRHFRPGGLILEGGCGRGEMVQWFLTNGFGCLGIDSALQTIERVKGVMPSLPVSCGSILDIPFKENVFDGYYSGGVFEHFVEGPRVAIAEAYRVLKPRGVLLSITPFMNSLRKLKRNPLFSFYGKEAPTSEARFYQYILAEETWRTYYEDAGFSVVDKYYLAGYAGLYHELYVVKMVDDAGLVPPFVSQFLDETILSRVTGHSILFVLAKE